MFFVVLFIPPLYLAIKNKWGAFVVNLILMILAAVTMPLFLVGFIFWFLAIGHAAWHYRQEQMEKHAELIAQKMKQE
jgi:hypothetical protein